jgi:hypothetical protein
MASEEFTGVAPEILTAALKTMLDKEGLTLQSADNVAHEEAASRPLVLERLVLTPAPADILSRPAGRFESDDLATIVASILEVARTVREHNIQSLLNFIV